MSNQEWLPVPRYEGFYEVCDQGLIRNIKPRPGTYVGKVLKNHIGKKGYPVVTLTADGKQRRLIKVHQIVAEVFIGPCPEGKMVNHKDGIKSHVYLDNLEYVTDQENRDRAKRTGLMASGPRHGSRTFPESRTIGERNPMARLTAMEAASIKSRLSESVGALAAGFNVSRSTIGDIKAGRTWKVIS